MTRYTNRTSGDLLDTIPDGGDRYGAWSLPVPAVFSYAVHKRTKHWAVARLAHPARRRHVCDLGGCVIRDRRPQIVQRDANVNFLRVRHV